MWDENDAKVVCKQLGFSTSTKAVSIKNSAFVPSSINYLIDKVQCIGLEPKIHGCTYRTMHYCNSAMGAGVVCVDPTRAQLSGGSHAREGNVFISGHPVCDKAWDVNDAQVLCNAMFGEEFKERQRKVPVFQATSR